MFPCTRVDPADDLRGAYALLLFKNVGRMLELENGFPRLMFQFQLSTATAESMTNHPQPLGLGSRVDLPSKNKKHSALT
jgi:hypothetical protein